MGCKWANQIEAKVSAIRINRYIVGCKLTNFGLSELSAKELIDT